MNLQIAPSDPRYTAEQADLRYINDDTPGITRRRFGRGFAYYRPDGKKLSRKMDLERINALAIPPAYEKVWICPQPRGHLQATGLDDRGRKQYRYHEDWRAVRDAAKFDSLLAFAEALPRIRRTTNRHLGLPGMPREKVYAAVVRVMEATLMRIGNDEYARTNGSFGLTTLRNKHAEIDGKSVKFSFVAKGGKDRELSLADKRLAKIIRKCQDLPGQDLFAYHNDRGDVVDVTSQGVNDYLREISGGSFTAKDFRTWAGTVEAAKTLAKLGPAETKTALKKNTLIAIDAAAKVLGNTRTVCRNCYVHPTVVTAYEAGTVLGEPVAKSNLRQDEAALVRLLSQGR